ncbi:MAG: hypothetical protein V4516_06575 [Pseudomonadota bacterium]
MFIKTAATALTVMVLAGSAFAQSVSQGDAQLAAIAGVPAGALSTPDLVNLINARESGDQSTVKFILSKAGIGATRAGNYSASVATGSGWDMVARANGVQPGQYTPSELAQMEYERLN